MISSFSNAHIKEIKRLRDQKYRHETGLGYIEGIRIVYEAILQNAKIEEIIVSREIINSEITDEILDKAVLQEIRITEISKPVFESISAKDGPQGIAAVVKQKWADLREIDTDMGLWVGLVEIADPGNLGTILRTCDGAGAVGVILIGNCTDPYDPASIRASMGAIFTKKIVKVTKEEFIDWVHKNETDVIGTSDKAQKDYRDLSYSRNAIILMGSERQGIPQELEDLCSKLVSIPMAGTCDSLNLAVATSIMLYEAYQYIHREDII